MHQAIEIDMLYGFSRSEGPHLVWMLERIISLQRKKSQTCSLSDKFLALGKKDLAEGLLIMLTHKTTSSGKGYARQWYCPRCGYLNPEEVSFTEKCTICGYSL